MAGLLFKLFLLGNFEKEKIIYDICIRSQKLANYEVTEKGLSYGRLHFPGYAL